MKNPQNHDPGHEPPRTKAEKALTLGTAKAMLSEHMALLQLDLDLAHGLLKLVPKAITQASEKKPDTRLLRLLVRYSAAANRRHLAAQKNR